MSDLIPDGWAEHRQGDIADFSNGKAYKLTEWEKTGTPVIRLQNLTGSGKNFYYSNLQLPERQYCESGDLLYMWSATFGPHIWKGPKAIYHYHIWKITCNEKDLTKSYLYHLLGYKTAEWLNKSNGMGILHITKGGMEELKLLLPPLPEQQKIAAILTSVDEVIEKTQAQIDKLKDLKTGMMQELLTRGVGVDGKPHTEFKDSPVGRIPKGWDVATLDTLASVVDSMHQTPSFTENGEPMVRVTEIRQSEILNIDGAMTVDEQTFMAFSKNYQPQIGDTLIARVGAYFGATAYISKKDIFCLGQNTASIRPTKIHDEFLFIYLNSEPIRSQMNDAVAVGAQPSLSLKAIKDLKIAIPSTSEQQVIAKAIGSVRYKLLSLQLKLEQQKNIKKALMQDLLTGKVRVKLDS